MVGKNLDAVQNRYNKKINVELRKILGYCKEYGTMVFQSKLANEAIEHSKVNFEIFLNSKIRGIVASFRKNPVEFINAYIDISAEWLHGYIISIIELTDTLANTNN